LAKVIGPDYAGTWIRDGAATYDRFEETLHQECVDHALRRAHKLQDRHSGRAWVFPRQVIDLQKETLAVRDDFRVRLPAGEEGDAAIMDHRQRFDLRLRAVDRPDLCIEDNEISGCQSRKSQVDNRQTNSEKAQHETPLDKVLTCLYWRHQKIMEMR
jgi:hypothetical protein